MASQDTGDRDGRPAGSAGSKDLLAFTIGGVTPTFPNLAPYLIRRVNDLNATASPVATITAPAALDIGGTVRVGFDRKLIGPGAAANFAIGYSGAAPVVPAAGEFAYGSGASQLAIDGYLGAGESVVFTPAAAAVAAHAGGTLDLYAAESTAIPGDAAITDTMGIPYVSPNPAKPFLLGSAAIGAPRLYLRTELADTGAHAGALCNSPDIGIYHDPAPTDASIRAEFANPSFATATNDIWDASSVGPARKNRLVVRTFNDGTMRSRGLKTVLYYTDPGTLSMPTSWHPVCNVGTSPYEFFSGDEAAALASGTPGLAVSSVLDWNLNLPAYTTDPAAPWPNHYCFLGLTAADNDWVYSGTTNPIPSLAELSTRITTLDQFYDFVRKRNVAWKNFMTIQYVEKASTGSSGSAGNAEPDWDFGKHVRPVWVEKGKLRIPVKLPVSVKKEFIQLSIENGLPVGAKVDFLAKREFIMKDIITRRATAWKPHGEIAAIEALGGRENYLPDLVAGPGAKTGVMLDVAFPDMVRPGNYRVDVVQHHRGAEIGRLTVIVQKRRANPFIRDDRRRKAIEMREIDRIRRS